MERVKQRDMNEKHNFKMFSTRFPQNKDSGVSLSPLEYQQFQRLKVNRVAVIQELKVDHVLQSLQASLVLSEEDITLINAGQTMQEKSKRLLDILPTKGRTTNWYKNFRAALLNPCVNDLSIRYKYQILVEFLDNTIIEQMTHPVRLSHKDSKDSLNSYSKYKPLPGIIKNDSRPPTNARFGQKQLADNYKLEAGTKNTTSLVNMATRHKETIQQAPAKTKWSIEQLEGTNIPYSVQYWDQDPENFLSFLEFSQKEILDLEKSSHKVDNALALQEKEAFSKMKQLEIAFFLWKQQKVSDDMVFCTCSAVLDIIQDPHLHHLYFNYIESLKKDYDMEILTEVVNSYDEITQWLAGHTDIATMDQLVQLGINLIKFLSEYKDFELAKQVLCSLFSYLANNDGVEVWMPMFRVNVQGMALSNQAHEFTEADKFYLQAATVREQIGMVSFGQDLLDCSQLFLQTSIMMKELGSFGPSYTWAQKSMLEVELDNSEVVINVLCNASQTYSNQWKLMRAEDLAVEAVQQAKMVFGVYHPLYLKALQNFVTFSYQYRKDEFGVEASIAAINITHKIYGYDCLQLAEALAGKAMALMAINKLDGDEFMKCAEKAYAIAVDKAPLEHPVLIPFIHALVCGLIRKAENISDTQVQEELLCWAEGEAKRLLSISQKNYGDISYKAASALLLLHDVYSAGKRDKEAEDTLALSCSRLQKCMDLNHGTVHLTNTLLAERAISSKQISKAEGLLKRVVNHFDTGTYYMPWYNKACELLISCYEQLESNELVKEYRSKHLGWKWISEDNHRQIKWRQLHAVPEGYDSFLQKFELWRSKVKKVQDHLEKLKISK